MLRTSRVSWGRVLPMFFTRMEYIGECLPAGQTRTTKQAGESGTINVRGTDTPGGFDVTGLVHSFRNSVAERMSGQIGDFFPGSV
jgi:hypothetical protein